MNLETLYANQTLLRDTVGKINKQAIIDGLVCRFAPVNDKYMSVFKREPYFALALSNKSKAYYLFFNCGNYVDSNIPPFNKLSLFTSITLIEDVNFNKGIITCHFHIKSDTDVESMLAYLKTLFK